MVFGWQQTDCRLQPFLKLGEELAQDLWRPFLRPSLSVLWRSWWLIWNLLHSADILRSRGQLGFKLILSYGICQHQLQRAPADLKTRVLHALSQDGQVNCHPLIFTLGNMIIQTFAIGYSSDIYQWDFITTLDLNMSYRMTLDLFPSPQIKSSMLCFGQKKRHPLCYGALQVRSIVLHLPAWKQQLVAAWTTSKQTETRH